MSIKMLYEKDGTTPMGSALNVGFIGNVSTAEDRAINTVLSETRNGWITVWKTGQTASTDIVNIQMERQAVASVNGQDAVLSAPIRAGQNYKVESTGGGRFNTVGSYPRQKPEHINTHGLRPCVRLCEQGVC